MKKYFTIIFILFSSNFLHAKDNLKFYVEKALENNLQLNAERKISNLQSKVKIFLEVNFYLALQFQEINQVLLLLTELIKMVQV